MKIEYNTENAPTIADFHLCEKFVRGIRGPIGSGKSVGCCMEIVRRSLQQKAGIDGISRSRWAVIRNTYPELISTTIKTWTDWLKPTIFGDVVYHAPITHDIALDSTHRLEVIFLALDKEKDIKKLLSLELTGVWINEAKEVPKAVLDMATGRVGRYPAERDGGPTWFGVIMDTNSPDDDHWWYNLAEEIKPHNYQFFVQPSGLSAQAENLPNLPRDYYINQIPGKMQEWIDVFINGKYGSVEDGKPVYPEWNHLAHVSQEALGVYRGRPLIVGIDFGLTPAAAICQISSRGQFRILKELVTEDMGIKRFISDVLTPTLKSEFQEMEVVVYGDPAGNQRAQTDERTCFDELVSAGYRTYAAPSNAFAARRESVAEFLLKYADKQPGMIVDPSCKYIIKGFNGRYRYRRMQVAGTARYTESPEKNIYSHVHDGLQYACLSSGMVANNNDYQPVKQVSVFCE